MASKSEKIEKIQNAINAGKISLQDKRVQSLIAKGFLERQEKVSIKDLLEFGVRRGIGEFGYNILGSLSQVGEMAASPVQVPLEKILSRVGVEPKEKLSSKLFSVAKKQLLPEKKEKEILKEFPSLAPIAQGVGEMITLAPAGALGNIMRPSQAAGLVGALSGLSTKPEEGPLERTKRSLIGLGVGAGAGKLVEKFGPKKVAEPFLKQKDLTTLGKIKASTAEAVSTRLKKFGPEGEELLRKINTVEAKIAPRLGRAEKTIRESLSELTDAETENFVDVLDKGVGPINQRVSSAVSKIQTLLKGVAQEAKGKVPRFEGRSLFFPRQFKKETLKKILGDQDIISKKASELVKSGKYQSLPEAEEAIKDSFRQQLGGRRFGGLDFPREVDLPGWIRDPKIVLPRYFRGAYKRLAEIDEFGLADKNVRDLIKGIETKIGPESSKFAEDAMKAVVRDYKDLSTLADISKAARTYEVITKLGLAQITNMGQTANTFIRTGLKPTINGIRASFTKEGKAFAEEAGAFADSISDDFAESSTKADNFLGRIGFRLTEGFNRRVSANAGLFYAKQNFGKLLKNPSDRMARRRLEELGIDVGQSLKSGLLDADSLKKAAFKITKETQFTSQPQDLPLFVQSSMSKLLFQFKTFAFQHGKFMKDYVYGELKNGNPGPLIRTIVAAGTIGELVTDAKQLARFKNPLEERKDKAFFSSDRQLENFFNLGGFGLFSDLVDQTKYGGQAFTAALAGPTLSDIGGLASASRQALEGKPKPLLKFGVRQVPVAGPALSNVLFSKENSKRKFGGGR